MKGARHLLFLLLLSLLLIPFIKVFHVQSVISQSPILVRPENQLSQFPTQRTHSSARIPVANGNPLRNWTVLIYMAADNDQQSAVFNDINEMEVVGSTQQVNIIVYVDFRNNSTHFDSGAYAFNITKDTPPSNSSINSEPLNTPLPTEPNMGDPATLLAFIKFGQNFSQAAHYMLILWDKGLGYTGVCYDETNGGDQLLPQEIALVLEDDTIEHIDITAFDASFMGQLELAFEIQEGTDYIIFSEETVLTNHFPYHLFLNSLILFEDSPPILLAREVVNRYIEAYSPGGAYYADYPIPPSTLCLSVINTSLITQVFTWFYQTINWLNASYNTYSCYAEISTARGLTQQFSVPHYIDLGNFAWHLFQRILDPTFKNFVGNLSSSIQAAVSYQRCLIGVPGATGLGINFDTYEPVVLSLLDNTAYEQFLTKFFGIGGTEDITIPLLSFGQITGYLDGKGDSVYYRFTPEIPVEHTITLTVFQHVDEDFDLYLYDSSFHLLVRSVGLTSDEVVQWSLLPGQLYYIQIFSSPRADITFGLGSFEILITPSSPVNPVAVVLQAGIIVAIAGIILFAIYLIWRNKESINRAIKRYRVRQMVKRLQREAAEATTTSTSASVCAKCGADLPDAARFCPNCGETFDEPSKESTN
jgi:ribosomal protein L40E